MSTIDSLTRLAIHNRRRIVLPEAEDLRVLQAAETITRRGIGDITLLGDEDRINRSAKENAIDLSSINIVNPNDLGNESVYIDSLMEIRKHKNITQEQAEEQIKNPLVLGALLVAMRESDGCVAGAANKTSDVVRAALQIIGMKPGHELVSSFFLMEHKLPHQSYQGTAVYADCALVIEPDSTQLANIAIASADSAQSLIGLKPRVALLSFSTAGSAQHPNAAKVIEAGKMVRKCRPDIELISEVQFDAAISRDILRQKAPQSTFRAPANVFIFPDLQSANIGYKIAQRIGAVDAVGPILQGLKFPVNDLSRGCGVDDIVRLAAVTAVQSL